MRNDTTTNTTTTTTALALFVSGAAFFVWYQNRQITQIEKKRKELLGSNQQLDPTKVIAKIVADQYNLPNNGPITKCELIRQSGGGGSLNHNYLIETEGGEEDNNNNTQKKFILRLYLNDKYYIRDGSGDDFRFELELLDFIRQRGGPVVKTFQTKSKDWLCTIRFNEDGELLLEDEDVDEEEDDVDEMEGDDEAKVETYSYVRYGALFEYAQGQEVSQLNRQTKGKFMGNNQFHALGVVMAQLHQTADKFPNAQQRYRYHQNLDTFLLDQSIQQLVIWGGMGGKLGFFQETAKVIRTKVSALPRVQPYYGIIHGDFHSGNLFCHPQEKQFTVIDWDHCCHGYRIYEFAWLSRLISLGNFAALVRGYESVRKLSPKEKELIPIFALLRDIWDMGDVLAISPLLLGNNNRRPTRAKINRYVDKLRTIRNKIQEMEESQNPKNPKPKETTTKFVAVAPDGNELPTTATAATPAPAPKPKTVADDTSDDSSDDDGDDEDGFGPAGSAAATTAAPAPAPMPASR